MLYFYVKYSTGWGPPIGWCRSETDLPRPNLTNFDAVFCKKYLAIWFRENTFFLGLIITFLGPEKLIFSTLWCFSKIEGRPSISENYLTGELLASSTLLPPLFLMKCIAWFPTPNGSEKKVSSNVILRSVVFQTISFSHRSRLKFIYKGSGKLSAHCGKLCRYYAGW